jgi:hypothetical protein
MATKFIKITFILISAFLIHSCSKDNNPVIPENKIVFGLYYLKDSTLKTYNISTENPDTLKLQDKPFISNLDIDYYDYSSHCIYLKKEKNSYFPFTSDLKPEFKPFIDKPFVVLASGKICYVGYFFNMVLGHTWNAPEIGTENYGYYPKDILHIDWPSVFTFDKRNNDMIKEALINSNIYNPGLKVEITKIAIYPADTTTVEYSLIITNSGPDNLYVLDPEKAGTYFHYYTNGPFFYNNDTKVYSSTRKIVTKPDPYYSWEPGWFTRIERSNNVKWTIKLKGYPDIPYGNYLMNFKFTSPIYTMEKESRMRSDGRYWIGYTYSGIMGMTYHASSECKIFKY